MEITKNLFMVATRRKYRFNCKGWISTEDLWDLTLDELDGLYKGLKRKEAAESENSLLGKSDAANEELQDKIKIIETIFFTKIEESKAAEAEADKRAKKQLLIGILEEKQNANLREKSADEIRKMLEEL